MARRLAVLCAATKFLVELPAERAGLAKMEKVFIIQDAESGIPLLVCQDQVYANLVADEYEVQNGRHYSVIPVAFSNRKPSDYLGAK